MNPIQANQQANTPEVTKVPLPEGQIVVNQTIIRPIDRSIKDIGYWRMGHIAAERVVYPNRVRLYDLYADVILDAHLKGIWKKRVAAVVNKKVNYYDKDGHVVDEMERRLISSSAFRDLKKELMQKHPWGTTGIEAIPGSEFAFKKINRKHIKPEIGIIAIEQYGTEGFDYTKLPLVWVVGDADNFGFLLECAPYALYKRGTMADWSQFSEIFGMPMRVAKYDTNDLKTKIELKTALDESGSALVMMIPKQAEFEIIDGKVTNADGSIYSNLKDACNQEMSVLVLGATETTTSSQKSGYAQGKVHADQQLEITKEDLEDMQTMLNDKKFIAILRSYGLPVSEGGMFKFEEEVNLDDLSKRILIDIPIAKIVPVSDDYFYDTYGIDKPDNYAELKKKMESQAVPPGADPAPDPEAAPSPEDDPEDAPDAPSNSLNKWERLRMLLANFFDPARND